jgi:hypothetical protein
VHVGVDFPCLRLRFVIGTEIWMLRGPSPFLGPSYLYWGRFWCCTNCVFRRDVGLNHMVSHIMYRSVE